MEHYLEYIVWIAVVCGGCVAAAEPISTTLPTTRTTTLLLSQSLGERGDVVVLFNETPMSESGNGWFLQYYYLFLSAQDHGVTQAGLTSCTASGPVRTGPDEHILDAYITPEGDVAHVEFLDGDYSCNISFPPYRGVFGGGTSEKNVPWRTEGNNFTLIQDRHEDRPKTPMHTRITGSLRTKDLTVMLWNDKERHAFVWDSDPDHPHWRELSGSAARPATASTSPAIPSRTTSMVLWRSLGERGDLVVLLTESPKPGNERGRDLEYRFLFVSGPDSYVEQVGFYRCSDSRPVGSGSDQHILDMQFTRDKEFEYVMYRNGNYVCGVRSLTSYVNPWRKGDDDAADEPWDTEGKHFALMLDAQNEQAKVPMRAKITGSLLAKDLTVTLWRDGQQFRFLWDPDSAPSHPWRAAAASTTQSVVK